MGNNIRNQSATIGATSISASHSGLQSCDYNLGGRDLAGSVCADLPEVHLPRAFPCWSEALAFDLFVFRSGVSFVSKLEVLMEAFCTGRCSGS